MKARITDVERILLWVPFVDRVRTEMERARIHTWSEVEVVRVMTDTGVVGYGETIQNYTWGRVTDTEQVIGKSPFELMWDDSLGAGLQMALFDTAGKLAGVPVYHLLGSKSRDWCPISFWDIDMSSDRYEQEARVATLLGYTSLKIKARPWYDIYETVGRISAATPNHFTLDLDWNDLLINVSNAVSVLHQLEETFPKIRIFEAPIRADDIPGNCLLRSKIRTATAQHYDAVPGRSAIIEGYCDGFVISGGVSRVVGDSFSSATANMPFFLQMVGTGITTCMALHLGATLSHAQWPAVTCHELYEHSLLTKRIEVQGGYARVPDAPGLGVEIDEAALKRYRIDEADLFLPRHLVVFSRACGVNVYFADTTNWTSPFWAFFAKNNQPVYERGNHIEYVPDDGSPEFADLYAKARVSPVFSRAAD